MRIEMTMTPATLDVAALPTRTVIVFDVLRATTSLAQMLHAGAKRVYCYASIEAAEHAFKAATGPKVLAGERNTVKPPGFDLGNSPGGFTPDIVRDKTVYFTTTNGTKALHASATAKHLLAGALVNASAVAAAAFRRGCDINLLASGSDGHVSLEDVLGAGAVIEKLCGLADCQLSDAAWVARLAFQAARNDLDAHLHHTRGGGNIMRVGLEADITFSAKLDALDVVGVCHESIVTAEERPA